MTNSNNHPPSYNQSLSYPMYSHSSQPHSIINNNQHGYPSNKTVYHQNPHGFSEENMQTNRNSNSKKNIDFEYKTINQKH